MKAYLVSMDGKPPPSRTGYAWWRFVERHLPIVVIYLMVATLVAVILAPYVLVTVPSGYVGVLWKRFGGGTVLDPRQLRNEGLRFILPWNTLFLCSSSALSCRAPWSPPSIAKSSSITFRRSTNFALRAKYGNRNARKSRRKGSANSSGSSARGFPTPICVGAASKPRFSSRSPPIQRS
jgi:hypothetical protein